MSTQPSQVGITTREALEKFGRNWPSRTIAGWLVEKYPSVFSGFESAYSAVRYYRGAIGKKNRRKKVESIGLLRPHQEAHAQEIPLPESLADNSNWDAVQIEFKRALVIQDVHIPYHDSKAVTLALDEGKRKGVDCIIINGDLCDFYAISSWDKDPTARDFDSEIQSCRLFLEHLRDRFPKARIVFKEGNHEERIWRFMWRKSPELYSLKDGQGKKLLNLRSLMDADNYGVEVVAEKRPIRCGDHLHLLHGHEFRTPFTNPVNPARGLYLRAKCNAFCGDLHQSSNHVETGLTHTVSCWSGGCLCDLHPPYSPLNKWNLGFALVNLSKGQWDLDNKKIIGGQVVSA